MLFYLILWLYFNILMWFSYLFHCYHWRSHCTISNIAGVLYTCKGAYTPTESSSVQSSQTHKDAAVTLWLTYNGHHGRAYTPPDLSRVTQVLPSQKSWCHMLHFRQTSVIGRDGRNGRKEAYSFS